MTDPRLEVRTMPIYLRLSLPVIFILLATTLARAGDFPLLLHPTDLVRGPRENPTATIRATLLRALTEPAWIEVCRVGETRARRVRVDHNQSDATLYLPAPLPTDGPIEVRVRVVEDGTQSSESSVAVPVPDLGWEVHFIPGFHYDPVWWNTQAHYTETGKHMEKHVGPGITLVDEYLQLLERDSDYRVAFHQLPYLKTFVESRPGRVGALRTQIDRRCCELVGGTYNELSTTLVNAESTIRNAAFGSIFQRDVLGGSGRIFWQCDVFGHDPMFPSLMARTGHTAGAFARGPFHQWGAERDKVNFPSEFYWMSPDGDQILTHYMTGHYGYAYARFAPGKNTAPNDLQRSNAMIAAMFLDLKQPALTHHVMLPMHMDFIRPLENLGDVVRGWNRTFLAPKARIATPESFFAAVTEEIDERQLVVPVITRDMNPIYTGCPVSFADLKTANREAESELRDAELWATLCMIEGLAEYPHLAFDRAWRQVLFNAHHDGITGSMSDQVYLDIMAGYRDAIELARSVKESAQRRIVESIETRADDSGGRLGKTTVAFNSIARSRFGPVSGLGVGRNESFSRGAVPSVGYRRVVEAEERNRLPEPVVDSDTGRVTLENGRLRLVVDPARGGAIVSLVTLPDGLERLRAPGNDVVIHDEYSVLPGHGEGPWHLAPTGRRRSSTGVRAEITTAPGAITIEARYPTFVKWQEITLGAGDGHFDAVTEIREWTGRDQLVRVEFPFDYPGTRPLCQTAGAVIGRPFARDVDTQEDSWTLDQACWQWAGLGAAATVHIGGGARRSIGVGEIVIPAEPTDADRRAANRLAEAWVRSGVTTTIVEEDDRRYGDLALDSNGPDFRILYGDSGSHDWVRRLERQHGLDAADLRYVFESGELPLLLIAPFEAALERVEDSLDRGHRLDVASHLARTEERTAPPPDGVAVANRGSVSVNVQSDGTVGLNLMRSCTSWPSGVWIDPPYRRHPDGSPLGTMHGSHRFDYRVIPYRGDHREVEVDRLAFEFQHPIELVAADLEVGAGDRMPPELRFIDISSPGVRLLALKPSGYPVWSWESGGAEDRSFVLRLWNASGRRVQSKVTFHRELLSADRTDHLESQSTALEVDGNGFDVKIGANAIETIVVQLEERAGEPRSLGRFEPGASPSQYWLENRGEGITGNGMVAIVPKSRSVRLVRGRAIIPVEIVAHRRNGSTDVTVEVEHSEDLEVSLVPDRFEGLRPGEPGRATLSIRSTEPDRVHRSVIALKRRLPSGHVRQTSSIWVLGGKAEAEGRPPVSVVNASSIIESGSMIRATVKNETDGPITGTARWLGPRRLWPCLSAWRSEVRIPAGGSIEIESMIDAETPDTYAMLEFLCGGTAVYGESIAITSDARRIIAGFPVDRVRLRKDEESTVDLMARSIAGLTDEALFRLDEPAGWTVRSVGIETDAVGGGVTTRHFRYSVLPAADAPVRGSLMAVAPSGCRVHAAYSIAPQQQAKRALDTVRIDADLSEWDDAEFTLCRSSLHELVRCAARYGVSGLALALEVRDDRFVQDNEGASIWEGDSIQFALSVAPSTVAGYGQHDLEFGAALTRSGPALWCWYAGEGRDTGLIAESEVSIEYRDGALYYEVMLPRSAVPQLSLEPSAVLGFSYIANDDDGEGYAGATQWTGGMVGGKDSSLFGELVLE